MKKLISDRYFDKEERRNFVRKVEDFKCGRCGMEIKGNGYTDHCPKCLWGRHVDEKIPGDRASTCRKMMEPLRVLYEKGDYKIQYKCLGCQHQFTVKADKNDDREELLKLINN